MVQKSFEVKPTLECMYNDTSLNLTELSLTDTDWKEMNHVVNFLESAAKVTLEASGLNYTTITLQPLMYQNE